MTVFDLNTINTTLFQNNKIVNCFQYKLLLYSFKRTRITIGILQKFLIKIGQCISEENILQEYN